MAGRKGFGAGSVLKGLIRSANMDANGLLASLSAADQVFYTFLDVKSFPSITPTARPPPANREGMKPSVQRLDAEVEGIRGQLAGACR